MGPRGPRLEGRRSVRLEEGPRPRLRPQLVADGVVATYIHDISRRRSGG
jgi:hypothetical protein